jgi:hypothetical protein
VPPNPLPPRDHTQIIAVLDLGPFGAAQISGLYSDPVRANEHARNIGGLVMPIGVAVPPHTNAPGN